MSTTTICQRCGKNLPFNKASHTGTNRGVLTTCTDNCNPQSFNTGLFANAQEVLAKKWPAKR